MGKRDRVNVSKFLSNNISATTFSTSNLIGHLKRHHGFLKKYNAWKEYEELSALKDAHLQGMKRKNLEVNSTEEPSSKQQKLDAIMNPKYATQHPRQQTLTNAIGSMIQHTVL